MILTSSGYTVEQCIVCSTDNLCIVKCDTSHLQSCIYFLEIIGKLLAREKEL